VEGGKKWVDLRNPELTLCTSKASSVADLSKLSIARRFGNRYLPMPESRPCYWFDYQLAEPPPPGLCTEQLAYCDEMCCKDIHCEISSRCQPVVPSACEENMTQLASCYGRAWNVPEEHFEGRIGLNTSCVLLHRSIILFKRSHHHFTFFQHLASIHSTCPGTQTMTSTSTAQSTLSI
jgi:hypothetical protein